MTDIYQNNYIIPPNTDSTKMIRKNITDWIQQFAPTHFMSVQFPTNQRSDSLEQSVNHLKTIMKAFEKTLSPRHWNRKHIPFVVFAENSRSGQWHFHIFLKNDRYPDDKIMSAIDKIADKFQFSDDVLDIKPITSTPKNAYFYANKELYGDQNGHFDSSRIFLSTDMFGITLKHVQKSQKHTPGQRKQ